MSTTRESDFEGPLPLSIKPDGFSCYRRSGCDREALCDGEGECLAVDPQLDAHVDPAPDQIPHIKCLGARQQLADVLSRNRFNEIAEIIGALTYAEMIEFARGLWSLRSGAEVKRETLPKILHAWATERELVSGTGKKFWTIDTAPKDRPVLVFMLGRWRIAQWKSDHPRRRPIPFWSADDLGVTASRTHQPKWWAELPPSPPEADA